MILPLPVSLGICLPDQIVDVVVAVSARSVDPPDQVRVRSSLAVCCSCLCVSLVSPLPLEVGISYHLAVSLVVASVVSIKASSLVVNEVPVSVVLVGVLGDMWIHSKPVDIIGPSAPSAVMTVVGVSVFSVTMGIRDGSGEAFSSVLNREDGPSVGPGEVCAPLD